MIVVYGLSFIKSLYVVVSTLPDVDSWAARQGAEVCCMPKMRIVVQAAGQVMTVVFTMVRVVMRWIVEPLV